MGLHNLAARLHSASLQSHNLCFHLLKVSGIDVDPSLIEAVLDFDFLIQNQQLLHWQNHHPAPDSCLYGSEYVLVVQHGVKPRLRCHPQTDLQS